MAEWTNKKRSRGVDSLDTRSCYGANCVMQLNFLGCRDLKNRTERGIKEGATAQNHVDYMEIGWILQLFSGVLCT